MPDSNNFPGSNDFRDESNFRVLAEKFFEPRCNLFSHLHDQSSYPAVEEYSGHDEVTYFRLSDNIYSKYPFRKINPEVTGEELELLTAFRRFKLRMRGREDVFRWKTTAPDGVQIVADTAEIILPSEVFPK